MSLSVVSDKGSSDVRGRLQNDRKAPKRTCKMNGPATAESDHLCVADTSRHIIFQQPETPLFFADKPLFLLKK
jgi:hypothetical protein